MKLAIYDFDGTYVNVQTLPEMYKLWKKLDINPISHKRIWRKIATKYIMHKLHLFGWGKKRKFRPYTMELTADLFQTVDRDVLDKFLWNNYKHLQSFIPDAMKDQLKQDKENGYHTVLLSGNLNLILEPFRQEGFDTIIGTIIEQEDRLLSSTEVEIVIEEGKKEAILKQFKEANFNASKAYADSHYDQPILELVGHPVAVNPDPQLRQFAIQENWEIIET